MEFLADLVVRLRWLIIAVFALTTALFGAQLRDIEIEPEIKKQLPEHMPSRQNVARVEEVFGGSEMVMVVLTADDVLAPEVLGRLQGISEGLDALDQTERVIDVFNLPQITGSDGLMTVGTAVEEIPQDDEARAALRASLQGNSMAYGNVVARDFGAAAVIATLSLDVGDADTVAAVDEVLAANPGPDPVTVGGSPTVRAQVSKDIRSDLRRFVPVGLGLILVFLYACFRQLRGVVLPLMLVVMSCAVAMGLIPLLGWKIQMVTVVLPVILLAVANDYGIHLMARFQEDNVPGGLRESHALARSGLLALGRPVIAAGLTTMAGLLCLTTHIIVPAQQLGVLSAVGIAFAIVGSLLFVPAMLAVLPVPPPVVTSDRRGAALDRLLERFARTVVARPRVVIGVIAATTVLIATGISRVEVDTNPVNYYGPETPVAQTAELIGRNFGGSTEISVMVSGDAQSPRMLRQIADLEEHLRDLEQVDYTLSIAQVVRTMFAAVGGVDGLSDADLPEDRAMVAQLFLLYSMGGDPEDLERMVDFSFENTLITARVNSLSTDQITQVVDVIEEEVADWEDDTLVAGFGAVFAELVDAVVRGQAVSLALSFGLVFGMVAIAFRSLAAGAYALAPLALAVPMLFGLMGWLGVELNIVTAMLSSIMIGVGVDYTIHFLWRYREQRQRGEDPHSAVVTTLTTVGRGIVFNSLSVIVGFVVLLLSSFLPVRFFGFLVVVSISACLIGALLLLPAICLVVRPRFLEPRP